MASNNNDRGQPDIRGAVAGGIIDSLVNLVAIVIVCVIGAFVGLYILSRFM